MADAEPRTSPLSAAGAAGAHATDAFALLADETRLAILLALWEAYDPHADRRDNAVPFSGIYDRVDYDDPGNLSYHLEKLRGQFIRQREAGGGYELRVPGLKLVQAVIAGAGLEDETRAPVEIDQPCPLCGAATTVSYREGVVIQACTECPGPTPEETDVEGFLSAVKFDPAGLADRDPATLRAASRIATLRQTQSMYEGLCPTCSGPVEAWLECCGDHDPAGVCGACGTRFPAWARFRCRVCKDHSTASPKALALFDPAVVAFYEDHGISTRFRADDVESVCRGVALMDAHELAVRSVEPPRVTVTARRDGDAVRVTFDETVRVVDVAR